MSGKTAIDRANPGSLPTHLQNLGGLGSMLLGCVPVLRKKFNFDAAGASASHQSTLDAMALDCGAKAATILRATVRAGGVTGELAPQAFGATPATTQIAVAPNGDIVALGTDAITDVDVLYIPHGPLKEVVLSGVTVDPATGIFNIPTAWTTRGVVYLHKAVATVGTVVGEKRILVPGAVNPATPSARLSVAKTAVHFTVADAVSKADITLAVLPSEDIYALLTGNEITV